MKDHFRMMARYNAWANARLYRAAAALPGEDYHRDAGAYFGSLHGTLNHLLVADRIWLYRLTGSGELPTALGATLYESLPALHAARLAEDGRLAAFVESRSEAQLEGPLEYRTLAGVPQRGRIREVLAHLFNHQTHHRGQAHAILTRLGIAEPPPLDLLIMQRETG